MADTNPLKLDFVTLDVFTSTRFLGNPVAVVFIPAALRDRITQSTKQRIAREFNLSETVFLHTLSDEPNTAVATRDIDIFTIEEELPFAGHPTIGTAYLVLHHLGWHHINTLQTKAGAIRIEAIQEGGSVRAAIPHAVHVHQQTLGGVLHSPSVAATAVDAIKHGLSSDADIRAAELSAPVVSIVRGMTFVLVRLPSLEHLARAAAASRMDFAQIPGLLDRGEWHESFVARYYYVPLGEEGEAAGDGSRNSFKMQTRMVELGFEDPATGSAACTLASYLAVSGKMEKGAHFAITQGVEMGRRSEIAVDVVAAREGEAAEVKIKELYLGGTAVAVMNGSISM